MADHHPPASASEKESSNNNGQPPSMTTTARTWRPDPSSPTATFVPQQQQPQPQYGHPPYETSFQRHVYQQPQSSYQRFARPAYSNSGVLQQPSMYYRPQSRPHQGRPYSTPNYDYSVGGMGATMDMTGLSDSFGQMSMQGSYGMDSAPAYAPPSSGSGRSRSRNIPPPIATRPFVRPPPSGPSSATTLEGVQFLWQRRPERSFGPKTAAVGSQGGAGGGAFPFSTLTPMPQLSAGPMSAGILGERTDYGLFSGGMAPITLPFSGTDQPTPAIDSLMTPAADDPLSSQSAVPPGPITVSFPKRPELGGKGRQIQVRANFFEFLSLPGKDIFHYEVRIIPEVPPSLNRRIFREAQGELVADAEKAALLVFDGRKNLYVPFKLSLSGEDESFEADVILAEDDRPGVTRPPSSNYVPRKFNVRVRHVAAVSMENLGLFLTGKLDFTPYDVLQAVDILLRQRPSMSLTTVGRSFFTRHDSKVLGDGAECWMGFHQSIRPAQGKLLVNVDISATAFYEPGPILNFVARNLGRRMPSELKSPLKQRDVDKCERLLKGVKIVVTHRGEMRRKYKISSLTRTPADETYFMFSRKSEIEEAAVEKEITVAEYFQLQYNFQLRFPHLPCLKVGSPQRVVYLPLEVCDIVPGQRYLRKLNEQQTAQMIRLTCQAPDRRAQKISQAMNELGHQSTKDEAFLAEYGVRLADRMMTVPARILEPPTIQYHPTSREPLITPREGSWNLRDKKVVQPATLYAWSVVCFGTPRDMPQQKIDHFLRELIMTCRDTGLIISNPHPPAIYGDPSGNIEGVLQTAWQAAGEAVQSYPQLIVCVLPNTAVPLYAEIKRIGDTVLGIPTQCVQAKHTFQPKKQYCANVCLKINSKLGGINSFIVRNPSVVGDDGLPWVAQEPTMIFGADVTHPAHGEVRATGSVCALVGSLDRLASRYAATVRVQPPRKDVILELTSMVVELLKIFYEENNQVMPRRILFYRDGCSENQFYEVASAELEAIRDACEQLQSDYRPAITFLVVQKRHHARVFTDDPRDADRSGNIPAGTVIDSHITHPNEFDFYLCSHAGLQGTSRPTHYHVLHDENGFTPDALQELTYRLCYGYARCTRSVSVVPPAYYADLVAFRAKYHMRSTANQYYSAAAPGTASSDYGNPFDQKTISSVDEPAMAESEGVSESLATMSQTSQSKKKKRALTKEEEDWMRRMQSRLAAVKPELQKVMYFM